MDSERPTLGGMHEFEDGEPIAIVYRGVDGNATSDMPPAATRRSFWMAPERRASVLRPTAGERMRRPMGGRPSLEGRPGDEVPRLRTLLLVVMRSSVLFGVWSFVGDRLIFDADQPTTICFGVSGFRSRKPAHFQFPWPFVGYSVTRTRPGRL